MREYMGLYRGKRCDNGEWVEGNLFIPDEVTHRKAPTEILVGTNVVRISYEVDPDTIGECTGLKDKNGKLIWEGDIVRCGTGRICKVTFFTSPGVSGFDLVAIGGFNEPPPHNWVLFADTEIIGNVVDNPELLEGGEGA